MDTKGTHTRRKIVAKSLQLFSVKGYFNTSINDIGAATGLTKGGLYGHFGSKEEIWYAVYDQAVAIWRDIVFKDARGYSDPLERIEKVIENDLRHYLGAEVFSGGCFFFNMLVELSGQSDSMRRHILRGFIRFSHLLRAWLQEADRLGMLRPGLNLSEIADFIVIAINGASPLYAASRDPKIWQQSISQLKQYLRQFRNQEQSTLLGGIEP